MSHPVWSAAMASSGKWATGVNEPDRTNFMISPELRSNPNYMLTGGALAPVPDGRLTKPTAPGGPEANRLNRFPGSFRGTKTVGNCSYKCDGICPSSVKFRG